jgi:hypothetical protein
MEEDRLPKKIFTQELEGTRRRGRPRKGWREEAERDLQVLGVRRWRDLVIDRGNWTAGCSAKGRTRILGQPTRSSLPACGLGELLTTTTHCKNL